MTLYEVGGLIILALGVIAIIACIITNVRGRRTEVWYNPELERKIFIEQEETAEIQDILDEETKNMTKEEMFKLIDYAVRKNYDISIKIKLKSDAKS